MGGACSTQMGVNRNACKILKGKPEGKRLCVGPSHRWENGIVMDRKEIECEVLDCIHLDQDRVQ